MLVLLPVYQLVVLPAFAPESAAYQIGFSHAYYGAIRHAITVGFISLMIVGVRPKWRNARGIDAQARLALGPFVLINVGCALALAFRRSPILPNPRFRGRRQRAVGGDRVGSSGACTCGA